MERRLDVLGRVVIPMEFRNVLGWSAGTRLNIQLVGEKVIISKSEYGCAICGGLEKVKDVKGVRMCQSCIDEIKVSNFWEEV